MTLVVLSAYPERVERFRHLWGDFILFEPGLIGLREAHLALAKEAVNEGWDESVHVIQDDVKRVVKLDHVGMVTSYNRELRPGHVCPKSFTATLVGWRRLLVAWSREGKTCELWRPDYAYSVDEMRVGRRRVI